MAKDQYSCDACGASFDTRDELKEHERMMHSQYKCDVCGQSFGSEKELESHELAMHPEQEGTPRR